MPCLKSLRGESAVDWSCSSVLEPAHKTLDNTITDRRLGFVSANDGDSSRLVDVVSVEINDFNRCCHSLINKKIQKKVYENFHFKILALQ